MKYQTLITLISLLEAASAFVTSSGGYEGPVTWTGEIIPGSTQTFHGELQDIYAQILAVDPTWVAEPHNTTTSLNKRNLSFKTGNCCHYSTAVANDTDQNERNLQGKACNVGAGPNVCVRVGCYNTSGVYLCNDTDADLNLSCSDVVQYTHDIRLSCSSNVNVLSGQVYDNAGWNVVAGYCNGNDPVSVLPSSYTPPGPNGSCTQCDDCVTFEAPE